MINSLNTIFLTVGPAHNDHKELIQIINSYFSKFLFNWQCFLPTSHPDWTSQWGGRFSPDSENDTCIFVLISTVKPHLMKWFEQSMENSPVSLKHFKRQEKTSLFTVLHRWLRGHNFLQHDDVMRVFQTL